MVSAYFSVWRLWGYVAVVSATASEDATSATSLPASITNMALHRPCHPHPACATLFDDDVKTTFHTSASVNTIEVAPADATADSARTSVSFYVFLEHRAFISSIGVVCTHASVGRERRKPFLHASGGEKGYRHGALHITTWLDDNSNEGKGHVSVLPLTSSDSSEGGLLKLLFKIELFASVVGINLEKNGDVADGICGQMDPAEVTVMAHPSSDVAGPSTSGKLRYEFDTQHQGNVFADSPGLLFALLVVILIFIMVVHKYRTVPMRHFIEEKIGTVEENKGAKTANRPAQILQSESQVYGCQTVPKRHFVEENKGTVEENKGTKTANRPAQNLQSEPETEPISTDGSFSEDLSRSRNQHNSGVMLSHASPLCSMDPERGPIPMTQIPFEREKDVLVQAEKDATTDLRRASSRDRSFARHRRPNISVEPLTADSLQRVLSSGSVLVLHLSAHGSQDGLVADDGKGTAHNLSYELLDDILNVRNVLPGRAGLALVVVNACNSRETGSLFAKCGIPHVICTSEKILDSMSLCFLRTLYFNLFGGATVIGAFEAAKVALRSNPKSYSNAFCLLPERTAHDQVLFPSGLPESSSSGDGDDTSSDSDGKIEQTKKRMPFGEDIAQTHQHLHGAPLSPAHARAHPGAHTRLPPRQQSLGRALERHIPPLPDNYIGRSTDVWQVLQYLSNRRAVVVCGADGSSHGIGKSVVLDAVHRAYMQIGGVCVACKLCPSSLPYTTSPTDGWIEKVRDSLQNSVQEVKRARRHSRSKRPNTLACRRSHSKRPNTLTCKPKFQSFSGDDLGGEALKGLLTELEQLVRLCEKQRRNLSGGSGAGADMLLIFDGCDHLIQESHFQASIAQILRQCPKCRVLLSTQQQPMVSSAGQFKVAHHHLKGIAFPDSVRLFLRRLHRPLYWRDLNEPGNGQVMLAGVIPSLESPVVITKDNEAEVMRLVHRRAGVKAQGGNPQKIIALASTFGFHLENPVESAA